MNIAKLGFKNMVSRPLNVVLTLIMLAMGVALISLLIMVGQAFESSFKNNIRGIDMVVGAKGSPLQLILSAIYQIDNPTGNISRQEAKKVSSHPLVAETIELSYGDSYKGRRIIGTSHNYIELYGASLEEGKHWDKAFEAAVGGRVAEEFNLKIGDTFYSSHGSDAQGEEHTEHPFTVVGILEENGTVLDRIILTAPESIWEVHHNPDDTLSKSNAEITAMLVKFRNKMGMIGLPRFVNKNTAMQAALPAIEVNRLFELFGLGIATLRIVALCFVVLGGISVFVSMINSIKDRAYEVALIRSMGASRIQVFSMVMLEALMLGVIGTVLGLIISHLGLSFLNSYAGQQFGISIDIWTLKPEEWILAAATIILCLIAAVFPAVHAMRMDVSEVITDYAN